MEKFKSKTPDELNNQLDRIENSFIGSRIGPESLRMELISMNLGDIKDKYPEPYQTYLNLLQTEAKILNFPDIKEVNNMEKPKISLLTTITRGNSFKIQFSDCAHVIKPLESLIEKEMAEIAGKLGIGPKQYKTKEGFLHEEFIDGSPLLHLEKEKCTKEFMMNIGQKFARSLKKLHDNNVLVNDQILTNDFGKSHIIIDNKGEVRFIDFGASIDISDFPNISDEAVTSLIRTDPFMAFRMHGISEASEEEKKVEIKGYRDNILSQLKTKEDLIQMKDMQLLNEGLMFLQDRLPNVESFIQVIKKEQV